jgi:hypothetical protein
VANTEPKKKQIREKNNFFGKKKTEEFKNQLTVDINPNNHNTEHGKDVVMTESPVIITIMLFPINYKCFALGSLEVRKTFQDKDHPRQTGRMFPKGSSHRVRANQNSY